MRRNRTILFALASAAAAAFVSLAADSANAAGPIPDPIANGPQRIYLQTVASGMLSPNLLVSPTDGTDRQFIVDQGGKVRVIQNGSFLATPFLDVGSRLVNLSASYDERGLLGLAFDPQFSTPSTPGFGRVFTYTSEPYAGAGTADFSVTQSGNPNHQSVVASWRVNPGNPNAIDPATRQEILRINEPQSNHNGGMLAFGPDNLMYISLGDGGAANDVGNGHTATIGNAQDLTNVLGKVLRIDPNGSNSGNGKYGVPAGNPFVSSPVGAVKEIYAYGLRNPFRLSFDSANGKLIVADVGQNNVEEIDIVSSPGQNFGWHYKEGTFKFNPADGTVSSDLTGVPGGLSDPVAQYDHDEGIAIVGGFVYHGALIPGLDGKYVFGDYSTAFNTANGRLFYADLTTGEIRSFLLGDSNLPLGLYVKGMGQDQNGEMYVLAATAGGPSGSTGVALKIVPEPTSIGALLMAGMLGGLRRRRALRWS